MEDGHQAISKKNGLNCNEIEILLDDYLSGEVDAADRHRIDTHLNCCESCRSLVKDCEMISSLARTLPDLPLPAGMGRRLRQRLQEETGFSFDFPELKLLTSKAE